MISLSSVFKPYQVKSVLNPAKIASHIPTSPLQSSENDSNNEENNQPIDSTISAQMIEEAKVVAEEIVSKANQEANALKDHTQLEVETWWAERRAEDEQLVEQLKSDGFSTGYEEGVKLAEAEVRQQYEDVVLQAEQLVEQAFIVKNQIIAEAEPFLLELSVQIAEKIIQKQLTLEQDYLKELIQKQLQRKREKGVITLCVSPPQFMLMNASREELSRAIDAQAELQIIPDASVQDMGCVIRSAFGTIDARIETQLEEIKKALYTVLSAEEEVN
jgi:flagellar assembly protein FliH